MAKTEAQKQYDRDWRQRNKDKVQGYNESWRERNPEKFAESQKKSIKKWKDETLSGALYTLLNAAKSRKSRGLRTIEVSIDSQFLQELWDRQDGKCAITGMGMTIARHCLKRVSLDRIQNSGPYSKENVQLVCKWVNLAKNKSEDSEIRAILEEFKSS